MYNTKSSAQYSYLHVMGNIGYFAATLHVNVFMSGYAGGKVLLVDKTMTDRK